MSPENQWLEDVFPIEIIPFQGTFVSFRGCSDFEQRLTSIEAMFNGNSAHEAPLGVGGVGRIGWRRWCAWHFLKETLGFEFKTFTFLQDMGVFSNGGLPQQTHGVFLLKVISTWGVKWGGKPTIYGNTHMFTYIYHSPWTLMVGRYKHVLSKWSL